MEFNQNTQRFVDLMDFNLAFCGPSTPLKNRQGILIQELIRCHSVKTANLSSAVEDQKKFIRCLGTYTKLLDFYVKTDSTNCNDRIHHFRANKSHIGKMSREEQLDQGEVELKLLDFTLEHIIDDCTRDLALKPETTSCHDFSIDNNYQILVSELNNRDRFHFPSPSSKEDKQQQRAFLQDLIFTLFNAQKQVSSGQLTQAEAEFEIRL
jgi:hypothetical protein